MYYHLIAFKDAGVNDRTVAASAKPIKPAVAKPAVEWLDVIALNRRELERTRIAVAQTELMVNMTMRAGVSIAAQARKLIRRIHAMLTANAKRLRVFLARLHATGDELRRYRRSRHVITARRWRASRRALYGKRIASLRGVAAFLGLAR